MRKLGVCVVTLAFMMCLVTSVAHASKGAAVTYSKEIELNNDLDTNLVPENDVHSKWQDIDLTTTIDAEEGRSNVLIIHVSMVTGVFSVNLNLQPPNNLSAVLDAARIQVRVLVDGKPATPGPITFDSLIHFNLNATSATFLEADLSGSLAAHSFTFFVAGPSGDDDHTVKVQARLAVDADVFASSGLTFTDALAVIGKRTLVVQKDRLDVDEH